jgi:hypothetical protein
MLPGVVFDDKQRAVPAYMFLISPPRSRATDRQVSLSLSFDRQMPA